jgi:hypothetical protein
VVEYLDSPYMYMQVLIYGQLMCILCTLRWLLCGTVLGYSSSLYGGSYLCKSCVYFMYIKMNFCGAEYLDNP